MFRFQYGKHVHNDKKDLTQRFIHLEDSDFINNKHLGKGHEITGQIDYVHPFGNDNKFELGVKKIDRKTKMDYATDFSDLISGNSDLTFGLDIDLFTDILKYNQQVSAAYLSKSL